MANTTPKIKIQLVKKSSANGAFFASAENIDLAKIGRELNCRTVRFYSFDMSKDTCELVIEPPQQKYAGKVAKPFPSKDGNGFSTGMWENPTQKGSITATNGALDVDESIRVLKGQSSVSVAIFRNGNKTAEDKKPHWNLKLSVFVPKERTQPAQAGASSDRPM